MKFSVIINNFNYRHYIAEAIDSALIQTIQPFEIIVVDDGSTDDSVAFLRGQYSGKIKIIESENKGQLSAFVLGYQQARGDFVAFLDADDIWKPNHLQVVKDVLDRHPKVDFVMTNNEYFGNATGNFWKGKHDIDYGTSRFVAWTRDWIGSPTSSLVVRHDLLAFISDLTDATLADWRIRADDVLVYGGSIFGGHKYRIAAPTVHYRVHNNNGFFGIKMTSQANKRWKIRVAALIDLFKRMTQQDKISVLQMIETELRINKNLTFRQRRRFARLAIKADGPLLLRLKIAFNFLLAYPA